MKIHVRMPSLTKLLATLKEKYRSGPRLADMPMTAKNPVKQSRSDVMLTIFERRLLDFNLHEYIHTFRSFLNTSTPTNHHDGCY